MTELTKEEKALKKVKGRLAEVSEKGFAKLKVTLLGDGEIATGDIPPKPIRHVEDDTFIMPEHLALGLVNRGFAVPVKMTKDEIEALG